MRRFLLTLSVTVFCALSIFADESKLSVSSRMFLDEQRGALSFKRDIDGPRKLGHKPVEGDWERVRSDSRPIVAPVTIDGREYVSCFVRLHNARDLSGLQSLGVVIDEEFDGGLFTALVPVEQLEAVSDLSNVKRVSVARLRRPLTNLAREASNVDDALLNTPDAQALGLSSEYDGSGVILGIIDTGIDFQHIAFKDADGKSRIKQAYVYNGITANTYSTVTSLSPTTDDRKEDHGTHTSSTAGGSSVIIDGNTVSVTNDHAAATYGGMAPGADLYLAGINGLADTYLTNAVKNMCAYADAQNKPLVVSNSWGSQWGPHDGTGDVADVYNSLFGDDHPGRVALFAASNDAGRNSNGGYHVSGRATSDAPLGTIARCHAYSDTDDGYFYYGLVANAWTRTPLRTGNMACKVLVLDADGDKLAETEVTEQGSVSGLSEYYSGTLTAYFDYLDSEKSQIMLYSGYGLTSRDESQCYTLAVQFYPTEDDCVIDVWAGDYGYFMANRVTEDCVWTAGSDDMSVSDEATIPSVISIGAYSTKNSVTDSKGTTHRLNEYTLGDIAYFSSYATPAESPTGEQFPVISAPGATIVSAVNHYDTYGEMSYLNGNSAQYGYYLVNTNSSAPYGSMEGTSMATPAAAGVVALWMQAAEEDGRRLTVNDVKEVMRETALTDAFTTTGPNATHFGAGKIDATAGLQYILGTSASPLIKVRPDSLAFDTVYVDYDAVKTLKVKGMSLDGPVTLSLDDPAGVFAISETEVSVEDAPRGKNVTVTFTPLEKRDYTATLTLSGGGAETVTIPITGIGDILIPVVSASPDSVSFDGYATLSYTRDITLTAKYLKSDVTVTLDDAAGCFSVIPTTITTADAMSDDGAVVTVTYLPTEAGTTTASLTFAAEGAEDAVVALSGTAAPAVPYLWSTATRMNFTTGLNRTVSKTFTVTGLFIDSDVTLTLDDAKGVFTVTPDVITPDMLGVDKEVEVTVTFRAADEGDYDGTLTIAGTGTDTLTVRLHANVFARGLAVDNYLNLLNYASIDEAGWNGAEGKFDTFYRYTEYPENATAWLTMPQYNAYVTSAGGESAQQWFEYSGTNSTKSATWESDTVLLGSDAYFTAAPAMVYGLKGSYLKYDINAVNYYITNCQAVRACGVNEILVSIVTPSHIRVYECTENADGSLEPGSEPVAKAENYDFNKEFTLLVDGLDAHKIYKVSVGAYRGWIYEVGFAMPLQEEPLRGDVNLDGAVNAGDISAIYAVMLGTETDERIVERADVNGDGSVNAGDVSTEYALILATDE